MHYKNGREAKNGDKVVLLPDYQGATPVVGILHNAVAGNDYCNGSIALVLPSNPCPNLKFLTQRRLRPEPEHSERAIW